MKEAKQDMIDKIVKSIKQLGEQVQANTQLSLTDKLLQVDVLLDTIRFLDNYDKNVEILNNYYRKDKWKIR